MVDYFNHCLQGPVSASPSGMGVPDGDSQLSITIDHRNQFTFRPNASGVIAIAFIPGVYGSIIQFVGHCNATMPQFDAAAGLSCTLSGTGTVNDDTGVLNGHTLPYAQLPTNLGTTAYGPNGVAKFRPIMQVADISFTGSSMENAGSVTVCKMAYSSFDTNQLNFTPGSEYARANTSIWQTNGSFPTDPSGCVNQGKSTTFAAKQNFAIRNIPASWDYESVRVTSALTSPGGLPYCRAAIIEFGGAGVSLASINPGISQNCPVTVVCYEGLQASASITVSSRTCMQYTVAPKSGVSEFAKPSPPKNQQSLDRAVNKARASPLVETISSIALRGVGAALSKAPHPFARLAGAGFTLAGEMIHPA